VNPSQPTPQSNAPGALKADIRPAVNSDVPPPSLQISPDKPQVNRYAGFDLWLHRITILMLVFVCAVVGVLLVILPWRPEWTDNHLLLAYPALRSFISNGFVRGVCSGLGLLDIWIGFWEAVHYHEEKPS
jgi:hypothetical protein